MGRACRLCRSHPRRKHQPYFGPNLRILSLSSNRAGVWTSSCTYVHRWASHFRPKTALGTSGGDSNWALQSRFFELRVKSRTYDLTGTAQVDGAYVMRDAADGWHVFIARVQRIDNERIFSTEEEACRYLFSAVASDPRSFCAYCPDDVAPDPRLHVASKVWGPKARSGAVQQPGR
jgi:hypothetical protein